MLFWKSYSKNLIYRAKNIKLFTYDIFFCVFVDSFVNSQEWTLARAVPDLKLVSEYSKQYLWEQHQVVNIPWTTYLKLWSMVIHFSWLQSHYVNTALMGHPW